MACQWLRMNTPIVRRFFIHFLRMPETPSSLQSALMWLTSGGFFDLLCARKHSPYLAQHRLHAIHTRIRLVAALFIAPTLIWIGFDMLTLEAAQWSVLAVWRIAAALVFLGLVLVPLPEARRTATLVQLGVLLAMPMAIYAASAHLFTGMALQGFAVTNANLYAALPLVVMAGISIFPLVMVESVALALLIAAAVAVVQLQVGSMGQKELLSMLWVQMLVMAVYLIACAIQLHYMAALLREASHDKLTGALTRRSGGDALDVYYRLACQQGAPLSVLFLDLDLFKSINDAFGHDAGDQALQSMVVHLQKHVRQADVVVRWGGEEFVVILPNTSLQRACEVVDRMMLEWFGTRPEGGPLTASIGVAERLTDGGTDWTHLVTLADQRMYLAKTRGRARCVSASAA